MDTLDFWVKIAEIFTPFVSVIGLGWWLRGQFFAGRQHTDKVMQDHETIELGRFRDIFAMTRKNHDENVRNIRQISIAIAKIKPDLDLDLNGS